MIQKGLDSLCTRFGFVTAYFSSALLDRYEIAPHHYRILLQRLGVYLYYKLKGLLEKLCGVVLSIVNSANYSCLLLLFMSYVLTYETGCIYDAACIHRIDSSVRIAHVFIYTMLRKKRAYLPLYKIMHE